MKERLFFVAVIKSNGQTGIAIIEHKDDVRVSATGLYFDRDLPFKTATKVYGDLILEALHEGESAVIATSRAGATSKSKYPFTFTCDKNVQYYREAKGFARLTLLKKQNIQMEELHNDNV